MKFHTEYLTFNTKEHREYIHITPQVEKIVQNSAVSSGLALVSAMHITAGVYVNDNEEGLIEDIDQWLEKLAPFRENYLHHQTGESNGDSHLKGPRASPSHITCDAWQAALRHVAACFLRRV